jgi:taurine---2-oxoglutarate transaminase
MSLDTRPSDAFANDRKHVFHSWSAQGALNPLVIEGGLGSWIWD